MDGLWFLCGACGSLTTFPLFERALESGGVETELRVCTSCSVLTTVYDPRYARDLAGDSTSTQAESSLSFYASRIPSREKLIEEIGLQSDILDHLQRCIGTRKDLVFSEIGYGRGILLLAAAERFDRVIGFELQSHVFHQVTEALGYTPANIRLASGPDELEDHVDVIAGWHTFEHLPSPMAQLARFVRHLRVGGFLYGQVPLYRPSYLCATHYWFFNARSIEMMMTALGIGLVDVTFDTTNAFMTFIGKKVHTRLPFRTQALLNTLVLSRRLSAFVRTQFLPSR